MSQQEFSIDPRKGKSIFLIVGAILVVIILWNKVSETIQTGQAAVKYRQFLGGIDTETTYGEGFHLIAPWDKFVVYNVRQQELTETMTVLSANLLDISLDVTIFYQPIQSKLGQLVKTRGRDYQNEVIKPIMRSVTREVIAKYLPEEINTTKRELIQSEIENQIEKDLTDNYLQLKNVFIKDIQLPVKLRASIEKKLQQEQESLEYEFKLQKATKEAERQKIDAKGKAEANKILSASLTDKILKEKGIEATRELATSPNAKVVVIGGKDGMPLILGNN